MHPLRHLGTAAVLASLGLTAQTTNGQTSRPSSERLCALALANRDARDAFPVLASTAIREASCGCLAVWAAATLTKSEDEKSLEAAALACIKRVTPAENPGRLPPVVLGLLEDAFAQQSAGTIFSSPKVVISTCKRPEYPAASIRAQATGKSRLSFKIGADGEVIDGEIVSSAGRSPAHKLLDVTALFSLMQCKFEPARLRGGAVDAWTEIEYVWKID